MNIRRLYSALCRRIKKINRLFVALKKDDFVSTSAEDAERALQMLNTISPDPCNSSIIENKISPEVDLQIVVPAYNAEKFICKCIDSIVLPPKTISYRLFVINDGSKDSTADLLKKYESIPEVTIIHQCNKGHSGARNAGLETIYGRYLTFVDSDDWVDWNTLENMVHYAEQTGADLVEGGFISTDEAGTAFNRRNANQKAFSGFPCGKVFKNDCFANTVFPLNYWFEDSVITQIVFEKAINKQAFPGYVYFYRYHSYNTTKMVRGRTKAVDSLYVTLQLHKDRVILGYSNNLDYYDYLLHMTYLTFNRLSGSEDEVLRNVFIVFCHMINTSFADYHTKNKKYKPLEQYIRSNNYGKWKAYCSTI